MQNVLLQHHVWTICSGFRGLISLASNAVERAVGKLGNLCSWGVWTKGTVSKDNPALHFLRYSSEGIFGQPHVSIVCADNTFSRKAGFIWVTANHSVWHNASSLRTFPEVGNWHHLGVKPPARGRGACFLHTEPSTQVRADYSVQLQTIVCRSMGKRQTVALLGFLFRFRCGNTAYLPCITSPYLEGSRPADVDRRSWRCMEPITSPRIFLLLPCLC